MKALIQILNGFLIGVANIIPGVSGGTFALVLGIFDRLISSLKSFNFETIKTVAALVAGGGNRKARAAFVEEWKRVDAGFLLLLAVGGGIAIVSCSYLFSFLLSEYPGETLAFFIGLIIPSLAVPYRMMDRRGPAELFWIVPGAALTVCVSLSEISSGGDEAGAAVIFLGGLIAVSAMILPGISGSFCLLVIGLYQPTLSHIKSLVRTPNTESLWFLGIMGLGIATGFVFFTRLLSFLLNRYRSATLAFLIGLILGSFWVLWPVKDFEAGRNDEMKKKIQIATAPNRLPGDREGDLALCGRLGLAALLGLAGAMGVNRLGSKNRELA